MNVERDADYYYYKEPKPQKPGRWPVPCAFVLFIILLIVV